MYGKQVNFTFPSGALGKLTGLDDTDNKHGVFLTIFESYPLGNYSTNNITTGKFIDI